MVLANAGVSMRSLEATIKGSLEKGPRSYPKDLAFLGLPVAGLLGI